MVRSKRTPEGAGPPDGSTPSPSPRRIAGLTLGESIGSGGVADVWHAEKAGKEYAFKWFKGRLDSDQAMFGFDNEARTLAALDHPAIVPLCDRGVAEGRPWLVTPLYRGGSLSRWSGRLPFPTVARLTGAVLSGLAHAHAVGVVHRDLKPSNLLLGHPDPAGSSIAIADFGVALSLTKQARGILADYRMGTPAFMAPEQLRHALADQGPWTDLYALGVVVFTLLSGRPPFGSDRNEAAPRHLREPVPLLPEGCAPAWVDAWIARLMEKDPWDRFRSAADAAATLAQLLDMESEPSVAPRKPVKPVRPIYAPVRSPSLRNHGMVHGYRGPSLACLAPQRATAAPELLQALFEELVEVDRTGGPRHVVVRGPLRALAVEAFRIEVETKLGTPVYRAVHGPPPDTASGLGPLVARAGRTHGMPNDAASARLERLAPGCGTVLGRLATSGHDGAPLSRHSAVSTLLRGPDRPVILLVEEVQHDGIDALGLATHLATTHRPPPVLVVVTLDKSPVASHVAAAWSTWCEVAKPCELSAAWLAPERIEALLRRTVDLDAKARGQLIQASRGDPRYAHELLAHLATLGRLGAQDQGGARLDPVQTPADLQALAHARLETATHGWPQACQEGLQLAAAFGQTVPMRTFARAADALGLELPSERLQSLRAAGIVVDSALRPGSWSFPGPWYSAALQAQAGHNNRIHHRVIAEALLSEADSAAQQLRAARHLISADDPDAALSPLIAAGTTWTTAGDAHRARIALELREVAVGRAALQPGDLRVSAGWPLLAEVSIQARDHTEAGTWISRLRAWAQRYDHGDLRALAKRDLARLIWLRDADPAMGAKLLQKALAEPGISTRTEATATRHLGWMYLRAGLHGEAATTLARGRIRASAIGDEATVAACTWGLGSVCLARNDLSGARRHLELALHWYRNTNVGRAATVANTLGDVAREEGDAQAARTWYIDALAQMRLVGSNQWPYPTYNLGVLAAQRGHMERAGSLFDALVDSYEPGRFPPNVHGFMEATIRLSRTVVDAHAEHWTTFDADLASRPDLDPYRGIDRALVGLLRRAAAIAQERGQPARAAAANSVADGIGTGRKF